MDNSIPDDRLGQWIDFCNAEDTLGIKNMKRMKNSIRPLSMAFEHGSKVTAPHPYNKFDYVYTMVDAPPSWIASEKYSIVLRHWCNMCLYFSDETNRSEPDKEYSDLFQKYTGQRTTVEKYLYVICHLP